MCYLLERGMRTLHARMPIHASNAAELAMRLKDHPAITSVNHPSLPNDPDHDVASRVVPRGTGMLSFSVKGGDQAALDFVRELEIVFEATSLGGLRASYNALSTQVICSFQRMFGWKREYFRDLSE